jgi:hypothetical protein
MYVHHLLVQGSLLYFLESCIADEVNSAGDKGPDDIKTVNIQTLLKAFLNMSQVYACFIVYMFFQ